MQICISSQYSVGCTFLDWSIHFLSGQTEFFNHKQGWIPLSKNPLSKINAHGHLKNHPSGLSQTQDVIRILQTQNKLTSFYPFLFYLDEIANKLNIELDKISLDQWKSMIDYQQYDYDQLLHNSYSQGAKVIFVSLNEDLSLYAANTRAFERMFLTNQSASSVEEIKNNYDQIFFKDSKIIWEENNLTNRWDVRERRALANNLLDYISEDINLNFDHYWTDSQNLWYNGEREIQKIMSWLELPLVQERLDLWKPVYKDWQKLQIELLQFNYNYKHILKSIVNNWSYPIDLTFEQEVIIQHCLIYQFGLNLKTWQLEKFPNNTKELHKLLEPNIHPL